MSSSNWLPEPTVPQSVISVNYYPFNSMQSANDDTALFNVWDQGQIKRDLKAINTIGIDLIKLHLQYRDVSDNFRTGLIKAFIKRMEVYKDSLQFLFYFDCRGLNDKQVNDIIEWCKQLNVYASNTYYKEENKPVVEFENSSSFKNMKALGFKFKHLDWLSNSQEIEGYNDLKYCQLSKDAKQIVIPSAIKTEEGWLLKRTSGKPMVRAFRSSVGLGLDIINFESWNNYKNGSYIQENQLDMKRLSIELSKVIETYKLHYFKDGLK